MEAFAFGNVLLTELLSSMDQQVTVLLENDPDTRRKNAQPKKEKKKKDIHASYWAKHTDNICSSTMITK